MASKKAKDDGKLVRQFTRAKRAVTRQNASGSVVTYWPKRYRLAADEVVMLVKRHIRQTMGDWMENNAEVFGVSGGYFWVKLPYRNRLNAVASTAWRRMFRQGIHLRRSSIGLALRAMHGEEL